MIETSWMSSTFSDNSVNYYCRFSRLSITIQLFFSFKNNNKIIICHYIYYAEKNSHTIKETNCHLKFRWFNVIGLKETYTHAFFKMFLGLTARGQCMESGQLRHDAGHIHLFIGLCDGGVRLCGDQEHPDGVIVRVYTPLGKKEQGEFALEVAAKTLPFCKNYF